MFFFKAFYLKLAVFIHQKAYGILDTARFHNHINFGKRIFFDLRGSVFLHDFLIVVRVGILDHP